MLGIFLFAFCALREYPNYSNGLNGYWQKTPPAAALARSGDLAKTYIGQLKNPTGTDMRTFGKWTIKGQNHEQGSLFFANDGANKWRIYVSNFSFASITQKIVETFVNLYNDLKQKTEVSIPPSAPVSASSPKKTAPPAANPSAPPSSQQPAPPNQSPAQPTAEELAQQATKEFVEKFSIPTVIDQTLIEKFKILLGKVPVDRRTTLSQSAKELPPETKITTEAQLNAFCQDPQKFVTDEKARIEREKQEEATRTFVEQCKLPSTCTWSQPAREAFTAGLEGLEVGKRQPFLGEWITNSAEICKLPLTDQQIRGLFDENPAQFLKDELTRTAKEETNSFLKGFPVASTCTWDGGTKTAFTDGLGALKVGGERQKFKQEWSENSTKIFALPLTKERIPALFIAGPAQYLVAKKLLETAFSAARTSGTVRITSLTSTDEGDFVSRFSKLSPELRTRFQTEWNGFVIDTNWVLSTRTTDLIIKWYSNMTDAQRTELFTKLPKDFDTTNMEKTVQAYIKKQSDIASQTMRNATPKPKDAVITRGTNEFGKFLETMDSADAWKKMMTDYYTQQKSKSGILYAAITNPFVKAS